MVGDELVVRAYSVVSSPFDETLEFFSIVVPDGAFTSNLQHLRLVMSCILKNILWLFNAGTLSAAFTTGLMAVGNGNGFGAIFIDVARL